MKIPRTKFDRFQGVTEEELFQRKLEDVIDYDLDILFVNINPGLYSVFKGHHYAGPGNHFYRCLQMSGLTTKGFKSWEDHLLLEYKFGLANMLKHPTTKGCQELSAEDIKEARDSLKKRVMVYRPKIVAFNGRSIYEIFTGALDKEFNFGKQPKAFPDTNALMFVMPSSSARNSQLPKVIDKVPFYKALKMLRDHVNGKLPKLSEAEVTFPEFKVVFQNLESKNGCKIDFNSMSESNSDTDSNEDKQSDGSKEKIFLNNLSYADLPKDILKNVQDQKLLKKNVLITTTTHKFRRDSQYSPSSFKQPDYDEASSDGSLNNFSAITNNLSNGISVIKNGGNHTNGKHNMNGHHKETQSPTVVKLDSKNVKIRDIVVDNNSSSSDNSNVHIKAMPITQVSNSANNVIFVSSNPMNGNSPLPQQQGNTVQIINATQANSINNQQQYVRYVLVANQVQQPAQVEVKATVATEAATIKSAETLAESSQRVDTSSIDFDSLIPLEQINVDYLALDQFYNFDTLGYEAQSVNDLRDTLRFFYENDDANTCQHAGQVKRHNDDEPMITKRRCKLNIFDL